MSGEIQVTPTVLLEDGQVLTYEKLRDLIEGLTAEILAGAITDRELADGTISADKLDSAVASQMGVPDGAVTTAKLATNALTADATGRLKMQDGFLTAAKIAAATITAAKLDASLVWPVGCMMEWPAETVPAGFLECNGAAVSRTTYAALFAIVGVVHGQGDGSTTFNLPDMRGYFARGWDHGAPAGDPDAATRTAAGTGGATGDHVGSVQADEVKAHAHTVQAYALNYAVSGSGYFLMNATGGTTFNTNNSTGAETRPKNKNVMYVIKY
jgi:microcystin-dependent protein